MTARQRRKYSRHVFLFVYDGKFTPALIAEENKIWVVALLFSVSLCFFFYWAETKQRAFTLIYLKEILFLSTLRLKHRDCCPAGEAVTMRHEVWKNPCGAGGVWAELKTSLYELMNWVLRAAVCRNRGGLCACRRRVEMDVVAVKHTHTQFDKDGRVTSLLALFQSRRRNKQKIFIYSAFFF